MTFPPPASAVPEIPVESLTVGVTPGTITLVADPKVTLVFDREGRPVGRHENGFYTARGLGGRAVEKRWIFPSSGEPRRHARALADEEADVLPTQFAAHLADLRRDLPRLRARRALQVLREGRPSPETADAWIDFLLAAQSRQAEDQERFRRAYAPVGILPPDQYLALVLQVTEGCAWNRCDFCRFYRGRRHRVRSREELLRHMDAVADLFGTALPGRHSVFLGEASALGAPPSTLFWVMEEARRRFPAQTRAEGVSGFYGFGEALDIGRWSDSDLSALAKRGLRRVYIGLESASDDLRRRLRKPGSSEDAAVAVRRLKTAGIGVGLMVLLGAGGREAAASHVADTAAWLNALPLGRGDRLYFSPLRTERSEDGAFPSPNDAPLTDQELSDQRRALELRL